MQRLGLDPGVHRIHWTYFFRSKVLVLEQAENYQTAMDLIRREGPDRFRKADVQRIQAKLRPDS